MRIFQHANYPFMEWRRRAYVITGVLLLATVVAMVMNVVRDGSWLNYGVDFKGGTLVQLDFNQPVHADQLRAAAEAAGHDGWEITNFGEADEFVIRMESFSGAVGQTAEEVVRQTLAPRFPAGSYQIVRVEAVGPKVGNELQFQALIAILLSFLVTMV
jgi:preprotein translocase subunit SecF